MEILFFGIIVFLFLLAIFDLSVGVSNDAVNFLNSAIGSKAAPFKRILIIAATGVFIGAVMSNGMMDIARHGIFRPEHFSFYELMCIFMAVMVTDIILLDIFNSLGMPTSTTVSMVFELLGATFAVAMVKIIADTGTLSVNDLLNTEKALSVIVGIFLSVAIAFFFGTIVQFLTRMYFSFDYKNKMKWKIGIFGGLATTALIYFLLLKGVKDMAFMTAGAKEWIDDNTVLILTGSMVLSTAIMQILHICKINVLKLIVLMGTFSLAMAFAGNDLVNFIGVPLSGLSSYTDYTANGAGNPHTFMMDSLNGPADTPVYFLFAAGVIMVTALATSKKTQNVSKTEIGLGSQGGGDEMFGSSRVARKLVRMVISTHSRLKQYVPVRVRTWINRRFDTSQTIVEDGAAFDLVRGSINLTLAGMLIAVGTSLKLPLSTTFVTFMVAMGTSLADRAWGRESAVFRITGVISVIGGWFITAGAAFIGAGIIVLVMYWGGFPAMTLAAIAAIVLLIRNNRKFRQKTEKEQDGTLFQTIITTEDKTQAWELLLIYMTEHKKKFITLALDNYKSIASGFTNDDIKPLELSEKILTKEKAVLKNERRKETLCLRLVNKETAIEKSAWFYLMNNSCMSMTYNLRRMNEVCKEHVENNFRPLPKAFLKDFTPVYSETVSIMDDACDAIEHGSLETITSIRKRCDNVKDRISVICQSIFGQLHGGDAGNLAVTYVYLNLLQETQEMMSALRKLMRATYKLRQNTVAQI